MYAFNNTQLTAETIQSTRQHFADIEQGCIDEVLSGAVRVNNPESYINRCKASKEKYLTGVLQISVTFLQRAYWLQTGEMIALLP